VAPPHTARPRHGADEERAELAEHVPFGVVTIDSQGAIVECNHAAEAMFGFAREEMLGHPLADLVIPAELRPAYWAGLLRLAAGGESRTLDRVVRFTSHRRDGAEFPVELTVTRTSVEPPLYTGFMRDLSDPATAAADEPRGGLVRANEELSRIGSWEVDLVAGRLVWSRQMHELFGLAPGDSAPSLDEVLELVHPDDRPPSRSLLLTAAEEAARLVGQDVDVDVRGVQPDGAHRDLRVRARVAVGEAGRPVRWYGTAEDVTEQRQLERALCMHDAVALALREWASFEEGVVRLVSRLREALEAPLGVLWTRADRAEWLICRVYDADADFDAVGDVEAIARRAARRPGEGLVGRAWQTGEAIVGTDLSVVLSGQPAVEAAALGLRTGVIVPAVDEGRQVAVLGFYGMAARHTSGRLAQTLASIGYELGPLLRRHRAELGPQRLTPREIEVLQLAAGGNTVREIADQLVVSPATVKSHLEHIYEKLGVRDRAAAVAQALRLGLIR
jgi:PAS domain S-box-containing protein